MIGVSSVYLPCPPTSTKSWKQNQDYQYVKSGTGWWGWWEEDELIFNSIVKIAEARDKLITAFTAKYIECENKDEYVWWFVDEATSELWHETATMAESKAATKALQVHIRVQAWGGYGSKLFQKFVISCRLWCVLSFLE